VSDLPISPIERPNTYELLAQHLLGLIASGDIGEGQALPSERELVERYGVGRSSVREALRMLESKGLIDQRGKGRFVVSEPQNALESSLQVLLELQEVDLNELFEVREVLEGEIAAFAAERRTPDDLAAIGRTIDTMAASLDTADSYIDADLQFHLALARASRNRIALHMMHAVREILRRSPLTLYAIPGVPQGSVEQHRRIFAAVADGDADAARAAMNEHLRVVREAAERRA
jgi:GntR family transcriptional repressor for pyruvate dehydrogenase complex